MWRSGLAIVVAWLAFVVIVPRLQAPGWIHGSGVAIHDIQMLHVAETVYSSRHGRYGDLKSLGPDGDDLVPSDLATGSVHRYVFSLEVKPGGYSILARPRDEQNRTFYSNETMLIRQPSSSRGSKFSEWPEIR